MRAAFATLAFAALVAAVPQGVTSAIAPSSSPPPGCSENYNGAFVITPVNVNTKRSLEERGAPLTITLKNGILMDSVGRTGYVASNQQFQFDGPPQAGAIYTAGFSVCSNGRLAIGGDTIWYKCLSGSFYNLYLDNQAGQCTKIYLQTSPAAGGGPAPVSGSTTVTTTVLSTSSAAMNASVSSTTMSTATGAMNGTMSASSSSMGMSAGTKTTTTRHTGGGATTGTSQSTTGSTHSQQTTSGGSQASASSASSTGAAALPTARGDVFGFAAGLLAFAVL